MVRRSATLEFVNPRGSTSLTARGSRFQPKGRTAFLSIATTSVVKDSGGSNEGHANWVVSLPSRTVSTAHVIRLRCRGFFRRGSQTGRGLRHYRGGRHHPLWKSKIPQVAFAHSLMVREPNLKNWGSFAARNQLDLERQLVKRESENRNSAIWLIGDSSPPTWRASLDEPLDSRHPARHNIWTPVLEGIQRQVFLGDRRRVDDSQLYVRNAVHRQEDKPSGDAMDWESKPLEEMDEFGRLLGTYRPTLLLTFGAFAFEFARRSLAREPRRKFDCWTTEKLGAEFRRTVREFNPRELNVFPLLHVSIARGHFLTSHEHFTGKNKGNYFNFVAKEIGTLLLKYKDTLDVWVEP